MADTIPFSERLKEYMAFFKTNNTQIAEIIGKDVSNVSRYLNGTYEAKADVIKALCDKHNVDPAWMLGYDVPMLVDVSLAEDKIKLSEMKSTLHLLSGEELEEQERSIYILAESIRDRELAYRLNMMKKETPTGNSGERLTDAEKELLSCFRMLPEAGQRAILVQLEALAAVQQSV